MLFHALGISRKTQWPQAVSRSSVGAGMGRSSNAPTFIRRKGHQQPRTAGTNQAPRQFMCTMSALDSPPARHMQLRRAWSRQQCFQVRGERVRSSPNLASSKQTIHGREDSPHHASSDTGCLSLSGRRRCHLVGICSAFLGLLGVDFSESGPV